jgi:hypothetical protein
LLKNFRTNVEPYLAANMAAAIRLADANLCLLNSSTFFDLSIDAMRHLHRFNARTSFDLLASGPILLMCASGRDSRNFGLLSFAH